MERRRGGHQRERTPDGLLRPAAVDEFTNIKLKSATLTEIKFTYTKFNIFIYLLY